MTPIPSDIPPSLARFLDTLGICERPWKPSKRDQEVPF